MLLMTVYSGFPSAINGTAILKEVINERTYNQELLKFDVNVTF